MSHSTAAIISVLLILQSVIAASASLCDFDDLSTNNRRILITNISEDVPVGYKLTHLSITGTPSEISLFLSATTPSDSSFRIALNQTTRDLVVQNRLEVLSARALDRLTEEFTLTCKISNTSAEVTAPIYLTVFDTNDHPPVFNSTFYTADVSELVRVGSVIARVWANDLDPSDIGQLTYVIDPASSPYATSFAIQLGRLGDDQSNLQIVAEVVLQRLLNYEQSPFINLTIVVKDNSNNHLVLGQRQPQYNATVALMIRMVRGTDYNPIFTQSTYEATLDRSSPVGSALVTEPSAISASTPFVTWFTPLVYSIVRQSADDDDAAYFSMNASTGQITTSSVFDASTPNRLAFQIQVTDTDVSRRYSTALVKISIANRSTINPQQPSLSSTTLTSSPNVTPLAVSPNSSQHDYLVALIIIGVVGGFLLLVVIGLLIFISRKTSHTSDLVQGSRSDINNGSALEMGFRATDDFRGVMFPHKLHADESSTDMALSTTTVGKSLESSGKLNEMSSSVDGSKQSVKPTLGFYENTGQVPTRPALSDSSLTPAVSMDPDVIGSTEILMGPPPPRSSSSILAYISGKTSRAQPTLVVASAPPPPSSSFAGSNPSSIYMSSPDGSMLSVTTQAKSDDGTGITVYY